MTRRAEAGPPQPRRRGERLLLALMIGAALWRPAPAEAAPTLPAAARAAWERHARDQCRLLDARFVPQRFAPIAADDDAVGAIERRFAARRSGFFAADFNGDGRPDFVIVTQAQGCAGDGLSYGQAGPPADFLLSTATGGYAVVEGFAGWPNPAMLRRDGAREMLDYRHGGFARRCGTVATAVWGWDGRAMDVIARRDANGAAVDADGCALPAW